MKQLEVQIMGQGYLLSCPEGGDLRLQEAVERVDAAMCKIRDDGRVKARDRIAVLAALNLAVDLADQRVTDPASSVADGFQAAAPPVPDNPQLTALLAQLDAALRDPQPFFVPQDAAE